MGRLTKTINKSQALMTQKHFWRHTLLAIFCNYIFQFLKDVNGSYNSASKSLEKKSSISHFWKFWPFYPFIVEDPLSRRSVLKWGGAYMEQMKLWNWKALSLFHIKNITFLVCIWFFKNLHQNTLLTISGTKTGVIK